MGARGSDGAQVTLSRIDTGIGELVDAPWRAGLGRLPFGVDNTVVLHQPQRSVHAAEVDRVQSETVYVLQQFIAV